MPVRIDQKESTVTAFLSGELDHHSSKTIREDIDGCVRRTKPSLLVLDFAQVEFMDSSGIGLVLGRYRLMQDEDGRLELRNMPPNIKKVMRVAGIETLDIKQNFGGADK